MNKRLLSVGILVALMMMLVMSVGNAQDATPATTEEPLPPVPTVPLDNPYAAFIDSRNYAISKGATAEWRKLEWTALDATNKKVYFAISNLAKGMTDGEGDIQMDKVDCGAIFMGELDANMNIASVTPVIMGGAFDEANADNSCAVDAIAGPDNLYVDPKGNLWIGEDTDGHKNNVLWMWDATSKELKRFATVPLGGEVTGLHITSDGMLFMNVQHPDETNQAPFTMGTIGVIKGYVAGDSFEPLAVPTTEADMTTVKVAAGEYQVLGRVGDAFPGAAADAPVLGAIVAHDKTVLNVCNDPDGNMFVPAGDGKAILYTNSECGVGGVSKLWLERGTNGDWAAVKGEMVDFIPVNGTGNNCGASVTPWGTAMTAEEYPADNEEDWQYWLEEQAAGLKALTGKPANPFDQGYSVELIDSDSGTQVVKHYAMGRFSQEVGVVMPDNKTVYFGDDGTDRVMFKFVADTAGDLSAGTLYAAKVKQDGTTLNLEWLELGHGKDADILTGIRALDSQFAS